MKKHFAMTLQSLLLMALSYGANLNAATPDAVVILSGGHGSCAFAGNPDEMSIWPMLQHALRDYPRSVRVHRTCFALGANKVYSDVVHYSPKDGWGDAGNYSADNTESARDAMVDVLWDTPAETSKILIGQSYGGWFVSEVASIAGVRLKMLATIDPISAKFCNLSEGISSLLGNENSGCRGIPEDIELNLRRSRGRTDTWLHFYQDQFPAVASADMAGADNSMRLEYDRFIPHLFGAHAATETDPRIWLLIGRSLYY